MSSPSASHAAGGETMRAPITRLPNELVAVILELSIEHGAYDSNRIFCTLTLSHICRGWRSVMLSTATFWTLIELRYPVIARLFCSRSLTAAIRVTFTQRLFTDVRSALAAASEFLPPHIHRVEGIHLSASQRVIREVFDMFRALSPQLPDIAAGLDSKTSGGPVVLAEFHNAELRRISFNSISITGWNRSSMFPASLTRLALAYPLTHSCPSVKDMLSILRRCSGLREVVLLSVFQSDPDKLEEASDYWLPVDLPQLRWLEVGDKSRPAIAHFLSNISIPETTNLFIHCQGVHSISDILPADTSRLRTLSAHHFGDSPLEVALHIARNNITLFNRVDGQRVSSAQFALSKEDIPCVVENFASLKSTLAFVATLRITGKHSNAHLSAISSGDWVNALACMPLLTTIEVGGIWMGGVLAALSGNDGNINLSLGPPTSVPSQSLRLIRMLDMYRNDRDALQQFDALERCLATREQVLRAPLESLSVDVLQSFTRARVPLFLTCWQRVAKQVEIRDGGQAPQCSAHMVH